ncbi:MAG TPA: hypothetical protein VNI83_09280, partial [Vicinamibacterales bacterium]|nr:hypothetical protein [Vicinamibacterales bacterium]
MIRARLLEPPLHVVVQAGAVADENGRDDRRGARARDVTGDRLADPGARRGGELGEGMPWCGDLDERRTLDRSRQRAAAAPGRRLVARRAGIAVPGRPPEGDRRG